MHGRRPKLVPIFGSHTLFWLLIFLAMFDTDLLRVVAIAMFANETNSFSLAFIQQDSIDPK